MLSSTAFLKTGSWFMMELQLM